MLASNFVMYFIILTTAATLHVNGQTRIETASEAAEALKPLAGEAAYALFSLGLIGTEMLGVPVLAGSSAYALAEAAAWKGSLERRSRSARRFYTVLGVSLVLGCLLGYAGFDAVEMLFWSAVVNGALAPPLILLIVLLTSNPEVMGDRVSTSGVRLFGWIAFGLLAAGDLGLLIS